MKIIFILSLLVSVVSLQYCFGQNLLTKTWSYQCHQKSADLFFKDISQLTQINILYPQEEAGKHKVSINAVDQNLNIILGAALEGSGLGFTFQDENQIVIFQKKKQRKIIKFQGKLIDTLSGEVLIGARVSELVSRQTTYSNDYGVFHFSSPHAYLQLKIEAFGYQSKKIKFVLDEIHSDLIFMHSDFALPEVTVVSNKKESCAGREKDITSNDITNSPNLLGENDLFKTILSSSGVSSGADGFGGLNVRGGSNDQNLILMDDVPIYYPNHAIGLLSIFNTDAIKNAKFYQGYIPSKFGGRLSSVLDVHTKEGNIKEWKADASLGLLTGKFSVEGPIIKDRVSIFSSYRRSILDPFIKGITRYFKETEFKEGQSSYHFFDFNSKLSWNISNRDRLYMSFYNGRDAYTDSEDEKNLLSGFVNSTRRYDHLQWGNTLYSLRYNRSWNRNVFTHLVLYQSAFSNTSEQFDAFLIKRDGQRIDSLLLGRSFYSDIKEYGGFLDVQFNPFIRHWIHTGVQFQLQDFQPGAFNYNEKSPIIGNIETYFPRRNDHSSDNNNSTLREYSYYVEDHIQIGKHTQFIAGVRASLIHQGEFSWHAIQPRTMLELYMGPKVKFNLSYVTGIQSLHLLSSSSIGLPTDLWVPSQNNINPQRSQFLNTTLKFFTSDNHQFIIGGFYKKMNDLIHVKEGANFALGILEKWEEEITTGEGQAMGLEFSSLYQTGRFLLEQNLTMNKSTRRFSGLNFGQEFPYKYDRPLIYNLISSFQFNQSLSINVQFEFSKGNPVSLPLGEYQYISNSDLGARVDVLVFKNINNARLPDIIRLNAGLRYTFSRKKIHQEIQFGFYNILNRKNPVYLELRSDPISPGKAKLNQVSLVPLLPSLHYRIYIK